MNVPVLAIDTGTTGDRRADHLIAGLRDRWRLDAGVSAATHHDRTGRPRVIVTMDLTGSTTPSSPSECARDVVSVLVENDPDTLSNPTVLLDDGVGPPIGIGGRQELGATTRAVDVHRRRSSGRLVAFPGADTLQGVMTVRELLESSAIDRLNGIGGTPVDPDLQIDTRSFVRPHWRQGELVLDVVSMVGGVLAPFEVPNPIPCCADHA